MRKICCKECGAEAYKARLDVHTLALTLRFDCACETFITVYVNSERTTDIRIDYQHAPQLAA